ncbi:hypothetical protein GP486_002181 [Trichoglossum hirsutum]|uniref:proline--tRNA ligase n=1 Tax=Trichoglossum hirsutum TaxID=265104 RepID=A0A9P8LF87_9PEZI|nr:hypothetical protein GP486_002181 [Trichoglossum hirsutum]
MCVRAETDKRDAYSPGFKFADWEQKGVPLRLKFGPGESEGHYVTTARWDIPGREGRGSISTAELSTAVPAFLETTQKDLYNRASEEFKSHIVQVTKWEDFVPALNTKNVVMTLHRLTEKCEDEIKDLSVKAKPDDDTPEDARVPSVGVKSLCILFPEFTMEEVEKAIFKD